MSPEPQNPVPSPDPWAAVSALGTRRFRVGLAAGLALGLIVHGAAAGHGFQLSGWLQLKAFAATVQRDVRDQLKNTFDIEVDEPPEPEPEPEPPPPEPEAEAPEPAPLPELPRDQAPPPDAPEPPPAAAEAGKVLTAEPDPNEPLDLTGDVGFVTGSGDRYVGGVTAPKGESKKPVYDRGARPDGVVGGTGKTPAPVYKGPDLSRPANFKGTFNNCGFPPEADVEQINYMRVPILVSINPDGTPSKVTTLKEVGFGFGQRAQRCAMSKRYEVALDRAGKPIPSTVQISVTFTR